MKIKKLVSGILVSAMCALSLAGCNANGGSSSSGTQSDVSTVSSASSANTESSSAESSSKNESTASAPVSTSSEENSNSTAPNKALVRVVALKGPTAMGLVKLADEGCNTLDIEFEMKAAPDEIAPMVAQGTADIFCVPANLASVLCNKTEGKVKAVAINTLGVLYICENGDTVKSVADLKGKTIYSAGKGSTPEYALNFILQSNGIDPANDVTIEWKSEHAECLEAMLKGENCVAMLPQPFVTTAQTKNDAVRVALDLTKEWDNLGLDSSLITGVAIVRTDFAESNPKELNDFLKEYASSVDFVNSNIEEGAALIGKYDIVPEAVAQKAIPNCNIVCITGNEMKEKLSGYLQVLMDNDPASVGGALPDDSFYYIGE